MYYICIIIIDKSTTMNDNIDDYSIQIDPDVICQDYDIADEQQHISDEYYANEESDILFE